MVYDSIDDLPLHIYDKIINGSPLNLLIVSGNATDEELIIAWENIERGIFSLVGMNDSQLEMMRAKINALNHWANYYLKNDKFSRTLAKLEEQKVELYSSGDKKNVSLMKICVSLSKALGYRIDFKVISVSEFFYSIELAEEIAKSYKSK